jgi:citrate lyase subunit beta / citryl-CoA lyase
MIPRSWLFVPADSPGKIEKAAASAADAVILDLEDSVAVANKEAARASVADLLASGRFEAARLWVRVNPVGTAQHLYDVAMVAALPLAGLMLPKAEPAQIAMLSAQLDVLEARAGVPIGRTKLLPIITETGRATLLASGYAPHPRLMGLTWGSEDLSADLGARSKAGAVFGLARSLCLLASAAAGVAAIDQIHADFRDVEGLARSCDDARRDGFLGKMAIHPSQIDAINSGFTPSDEDIAQARAVVAAFEAAPGAGVVALNGKMLDLPHLRLAQRVLGL